jgi:hypothetical protein
VKSKLETCARIAEIVGAIAVLVSVIYLAVQIRDNTRLLRSQAHFNALSLGQRPLEYLVDNESLAAVVAQCNADPEQAVAVAGDRCLNYYFMELNAWEYMYYQHRDDSIPRQYWVGADSYYKLLMATKPGYRRAWRKFESTYDEPFRSYAADEFRKAVSGAPE